MIYTSWQELPTVKGGAGNRQGGPRNATCHTGKRKALKDNESDNRKHFSGKVTGNIISSHYQRRKYLLRDRGVHLLSSHLSGFKSILTFSSITTVIDVSRRWPGTTRGRRLALVSRLTLWQY